MSDFTEPNPPRDSALSAVEKEELLHEIVAVIQQIPGKMPTGSSDGEWTREIIKDFKQLGYQWGYWVCPDANQMTGAWLYDLSWYRDKNEELVEVPMVLESEWSRHWKDIRFDFEKLLQAKAGIKVMIFDEGQTDLEDIWQNLLSSIRAFGKPEEDECYLLAGFCGNPRGFQVRLVRDARNPSLEPIP
jgi:hypothetical protein